MENGPSWEASSCSIVQEIRSHLLNPIFHYHLHKNPPPDPNHSLMNSAHTFTLYL
jgi:hypothetical protein